MFAKYTKLIVRDPSTGSLVQMLPEVKTATEVDAESSLPVSSSAVASWGEAFVRRGSESETISGDVTFEGRTTYSDDIAMSGNKIVDPSGIELSPASNTDNNGGYIDFRYNNAEESTSRIIESVSGTVTINNVDISNGSVSATTFTGALNGNAATTTKLATARTINGASFDGTGNITTTSWGTARNISISDSDGTNTGTAVSVNGSGNVTLKLPATIKASVTGNVSGSSGSCTGNAATATKLATTRAINGTNFDGSAAITTANWGTARNIYVSDSDGTNTGAAVSVNGSANATLKLPATIKASITGNCSGSSGSCTGNAATATKLATTRSISAGDLEFQGSANFDGSDNVKLNITQHRSLVSVGNTNNYPFHRIAYTAVETGNYIDRAITFFIGKEFISAGYGICRVILRTNNASSDATAQCEVQWLARTSGIPADSIQVGFNNTAKASYVDVFYKSTGTYHSAICRVMSHANSRSSVGQGFTIVATSTEANSTTTSDPKTSVESYATIAAAGTAIRGKAYTSTITASDASVVGSAASCTGNASTATKLATARAINGTNFDGSAAITTANWGTARNISISDSDGTNTGTAVSVNGSGNATLKLPATIKASITGNASGSSGSCTGNAATATKLATARSLWGNNFDGSAAITGTINGTPSIEFKPTATTSNNGGYLDFHYNQSTADYTSRIIESASGTLSINNVTITTGKVVTATTFTGALSGNASTATKLATARTIGISGGATGTATSFDGSGNITIPVTALDVSKASAGTLAVARGGTGLTSLDTFVRTTGNQTIAGTKTFSAEIMVNKGDKPAAGALSHVFGVTYQNTGGTQTHTAHPISVIGNSNADNTYNTGVRLGSLNGTTVVSAGESGGAFCSTLSKFDDENLYLNADGEVHVYVKCANDMATYAGPIKLSGSGNASGGTTSITATTFIGALTGNVTGNCSGSSGSCTGNAATATKIQRASEGTTYVAAVTAGKSLVNSTTSGFGTVWNAPTKNYRVGVATYPSSNDQILWYSVTNANVSAGTNTVNKSMYWDAGTGVLTATGFSGPLTGNVTGNCSGSSGSCTGNAKTATTLQTARKINGVSFNGSADITVADSTKLPLAGGTVTGATYFTAEYYRKDTGAVKGTAPSANRWQNGVRFIDNNNVAFGGIERGFLTDKTNRVNMIVYKGTTTDTSTNSQIGVGFDKDGNWFTYAPTPAAADNSTKIATTAWVRGRLHISTANPSGGTDGDIWFKYA